MALKASRVPVREQAPEVRIKNFEEVCYGYNLEEAMLEAQRCIQCKKPRCVDACPVSIKIPDFIKAVTSNNIALAADIIAEDSSLPAVCGRVCPQEVQCEGACILGIKGEPVAIGKLERFVADWGRTENYYQPKPTKQNGFKVAVIGSGPAGLACATDLAKAGYEVKIFEALHRPGGVLEYGIPEFRLPKDEVVSYEIDNVRKSGVDIETNVIIGRTVTIDELLDDEGYHAVFIGSGAGLPKFMNIPGENLNGVVSANEFLTRVNLMKAFDSSYDTPIYVGQKVAVVGGGNVAMDAARSARRLGAEVYLVYRRSEKELPARVEEVHHAKEEGINMRLLTNPVEIIDNGVGWVKSLKCIKMELGEPDQSGRRRPIEIKGSEFEIDCDLVIMSLGTNPNPLITGTTPGLETESWGGITINEETGQTSREGVFAGGDAVTGAATVILAMGAGRLAAKNIDQYIQNKFK
ncbi:MAG: NADPH-dependent glutamate synthase [Bacteroidales bacterium]|nr:NADPH-dependent glutamate synthase [Bacteroidales bacterium]